jgi:hypothetical protein
MQANEYARISRSLKVVADHLCGLKMCCSFVVYYLYHIIGLCQTISLGTYPNTRLITSDNGDLHKRRRPFSLIIGSLEAKMTKVAAIIQKIVGKTEADYDRTPATGTRWGHNAGGAQERDEGVQEAAQTHSAR